MPTWNERRRSAQRGDDTAAYGERGAPREDIHHGPWSPYNGGNRRDRDDDRESWETRGRDYWLEDDRWEDQRMGMGDQWRRRPERDDQDDDRYGDESWGNRMGMREEPSERSVPRSGAWQHEPRYGEMERMWSDRDDHPWPNERRATDEERREHRDYAHQRRDERGEYEPRGREYREPHGHDEYRHRYEQHPYRGQAREHRDDYARERGGEQYPSRAQGSWRDDRYRGWRDEEPRNWTDREDRRDDRRFEREDQRYAEQKREHEQRLRHGREEQRLRDEQQFGRHEPEWAQRTYQRGPDDRDDRRMQHRDDRRMQHRDDRDRRRDRNR